MHFNLTTIAVLLLLAGGCARTTVREPLTLSVAKIADPAESQLEFWSELPNRPVCCNDEAFHGLLLFLDDKDPNDSYDSRVAELKKRQLIPSWFNGQANEAVERGTVAFAVVAGLHIQGGWVLSVFPNTPRYAVRELMDMNLFPRSSPEQTFSGAEFVGIIGRVEDYQDGESAFVPAKTVGSHVPGD